MSKDVNRTVLYLHKNAASGKPSFNDKLHIEIMYKITMQRII